MRVCVCYLVVPMWLVVRSDQRHDDVRVAEQQRKHAPMLLFRLCHTAQPCTPQVNLCTQQAQQNLLAPCSLLKRSGRLSALLHASPSKCVCAWCAQRLQGCLGAVCLFFSSCGRNSKSEKHTGCTKEARELALSAVSLA